jgi:phosphoserine phosphatase
MTADRPMNFQRDIDLICFDVDGTLVRHPSGMVIWEVLNVRYGVATDVMARRYRMYLQGEITYDQWVALDVGDWIKAGATRDSILESVAEFHLVEDARETIDELKRRGFRLAVISGTLDIVLDNLLPAHPFDDVYTNKIFFDGRGNLASWSATPFDGRGKPDALREVARKHGIELSRSAFVGDGDNDVPLLGVVGRFVAYHPRSEKLIAGADHVIKTGGLRQILDLI